VNNYVFKIKISLVTLKDSQREIRRATDELKVQFAPPEKDEESQPSNFLVSLIVFIIVIAAVISVFYLIKLFHGRREEEEIPFEEPPFEARSPYDSSYDRGFEPFEEERE